MIIRLNRTILCLKGNREEVVKLLQGISSNDISKISNDNIIYNLFLSEKGKFLSDNFLFLLNDKLYLDCNPCSVEKIVAQIKKYKMRTKIEFEKTNLNCYSDLSNHKGEMNLRYKDLRSDILGSRIYSEEDLEDSQSEIEYHSFRVRNNIPEGSYDMKEDESLPIYFRMHELNAVSLNKGCYIGQEPTNRLFRTAIIRKRLTNFVNKNFAVEEDSSGREIVKTDLGEGKLCSVYENEFGFMMLDER